MRRPKGVGYQPSKQMKLSQLIRKEQVPLLVINILGIILFSIYFIATANQEFLFYVGIILFCLGCIIFTNNKVQYPNHLLWGLTLWAFMHMAGGSINVRGSLLYNLILIPISETLGVFRYDQLVHIIGFCIATLLMYELLTQSLKEPVQRWMTLSIVIVMAGLGVGALNEIIEFIATLLFPRTGVGGYINTALDLVADFIGALIALGIIFFLRGREKFGHPKVL